MAGKPGGKLGLERPLRRTPSQHRAGRYRYECPQLRPHRIELHQEAAKGSCSCLRRIDWRRLCCCSNHSRTQCYYLVCLCGLCASQHFIRDSWVWDAKLNKLFPPLAKPVLTTGLVANVATTGSVCQTNSLTTATVVV